MKKGYCKLKGFTIIELIVVMAILGVIAGILVPSLIGFVRKAERKADSATAKTIYNEISLMFTEDTQYAGKGGKMETVYQCFATQNHRTVHDVTWKKGSKSESYQFVVVCKLAGCPPAQSQNNSGGYYHWEGNDESLAMRNACDEHFQYFRKGQYMIPMQSKTYEYNTTDLWLVGYRKDDPDRKIEIWAGDSTGRWASLPRYRLYPDPSEGYV